MTPGLRLDRNQQIACVRRCGESSALAWMAVGCVVAAGLGLWLFVQVRLAPAITIRKGDRIARGLDASAQPQGWNVK